MPLLAQLRLPDKHNALHIYRHLLRETTYLPPICRSWLYGRIRKRFRRFRNIPRRPDQFRKCQTKTYQAYFFLRFLRSAVAGHRDRLVKLLLLRFGRKGKRRRILLSDILHRSSHSATSLADVDKKIAAAKQLPIASRGSMRRKTSSIIDKWNITLLRRLAISQHKLPDKTLAVVRGTVIKRVSPPWEQAWSQNHRKAGQSLWGVPWSKEKMRRMTARFWKSISDRILPPVDNNEWNLLERLAMGTGIGDENALLRMPTKRRKVARSLSLCNDITKKEEATKWSWQNALRFPIIILERDRSRRNLLAAGGKPLYDPVNESPALPLGYHVYTPRMMRRIMLNIWQITPTLFYPDRENQPDCYDIKWGSLKKKSSVRDPVAQKLFFGSKGDSFTMEQGTRREK